MPPALAVALGGACGALARYGTGRLVAHVVDTPFPWATWAVNLVGCFLIGLAVPVLSGLDVADEARFFLVLGFLGSFTTFSTYSLDTLSLLVDGHATLALLNAAGSLLVGLVFVWLGRMVGDWILFA